VSSPAPAGRASSDGASSGPAGGSRRALQGLLGLAVVVQLVVLYSPEGGGPPLFPGFDKVVHVLVFLVPVALALLAGLPRWLVVAVFGAQALLSEVVQGALLPHRSGDPWDAVADLTGVALGVVVAHAYQRSRRGGGDLRP
jgi:hypothetical protein